MGHQNTGSGCDRANVNPASTARRFRELFENIPDGVYESSPDGRILAANPALVQMLGYSSAEELQREGAAGLYIDPELRERNKQILEREGRLINAELHLRRKDGSPLIVLENSRAVKDEEGNVLYYQGTLTDITERKHAEQELRAARDQALETSRLKSQFLANISHELRTPLNAVMGMSQILMSLPMEPAARECAETIHLSARILMDHITEILDFSRIEAGRLELESIPFDPRELIHQAATMLAARAADKGLLLLAWAESDVPGEVYGDPARLQQVLVNLLSNAVKFTDRGEVELRVSRKKCGAGRCVLRFAVRDTGIGIPAEARSVIFEPFRQADGSTTRRYGGTGLGLAIVREILDQMGSRIELQSQPGSGSVFSFELEAPAGLTESRAPLEGEMLLLEPNLAARRVAEAWARGWGAAVTSARDCGELARLLAGSSRRGAIRAIVANAAAVPPGGNTLWQALAEMPQTTRPAVILVSAWDSAADANEVPAGFGAVRLKMPVNEHELMRALERRDAAPPPGSLEA
ncbi:MAG: PAS domain S-box protein, partial [Bryobacteraceae bacterium]|nr:PAS domain S-box protein [Bryobacteraceae bacterium]